MFKILGLKNSLSVRYYILVTVAEADCVVAKTSTLPLSPELFTKPLLSSTESSEYNITYLILVEV